MRDGVTYVTSAYDAECGSPWARALRTLRAALLLVVIACGAARWTRARAGHRDRAASILIGLALAALVGLEVLGDQVLDYPRCVIRSWLGASLSATLCLGLTACGARRQARALLPLGLLAIGFAVFVPLAMPCPDHVFAFGLWTHKAELVLVVALLPAALGLACLGQALGLGQTWRALSLGLAAGWVLVCGGHLIWAAQLHLVPRLALLLTLVLLTFGAARGVAQSLAPTRAERGRSRRELWTAGSAVALVLLGAELALGVALERSAFLEYHFRGTSVPEALRGAALWLLPLCAVAAALGVWRARRCAGGRLAGSAWPATLSLAALSFVDTNYVATSRVLVRAIHAIDARSGERLWSAEALPGPEGQLHKLNTPATPTAIVTDELVLAHFGSAGMLCCERDSGAVRWTRPDLKFASIYGAGASPTLAGDLVLLACLQPEDGYVEALEVDTGVTRWRQEYSGGAFFVSGVSRAPLVSEVRGTPTVLVWCWDGLTGYDLASGARLWHEPLPNRSGDMVANLVERDGLVYACSKLECVAYARDLLGSGADPVRWRTRGGPNCVTPLLAGGLLLHVGDAGLLTCLDALTGERLWRERLDDAVYATPIAVGEQACLCTLGGRTLVVRIAREYELLHESPLAEPILATPALWKELMLVRSEGNLYAFSDGRDLLVSDVR